VFYFIICKEIDLCYVRSAPEICPLFVLLQSSKEVPVDSMALGLYRLTQFYVAEITRGRYGVGDYHLRDGVLYNGAMPMVEPATNPRDIVQRLRESIATEQLTANHGM